MAPPDHAARATIAYQPALDGLRALAVAVVLLFHAGVPGFGGGYLGVSVFFTLSGFLITSLLVAEHERDGTIDLGAFYARRVRRLLPASALCIGAIGVLAATTDLFAGVADLRQHLVGSMLQVVNWVFLVGDGSYQDLLARSSGSLSPVEHFWSLAIEEQFYWVWPLVMLFVLSRVPRHRGRVVVVGALTLACSLSAPVIARVWGGDAAYWATPARMAEILMGALLALVLAGRSVPDAVGRAALPSLGVLGVAVVTFPSAGGPAYSGALPLVAVVSSALILGLQRPSVVRNMLGHDWLVWIGKVSYGLYLFHWPVFVLIHPDRLGWGELPIFLVRMAVTFAITIVSYELIEQPIRTSPRRPAFTFSTAGFATAALVVLAAVVVPGRLGEYWQADAAAAEAASIDVSDLPLQALVAPGAAAASVDAAAPSAAVASARDPEQPTEPAATSPTSTISAAASTPATTTTAATTTTITTTIPTIPTIPELSRPVRIVVAGDSTAKAFGVGLVNWAAANPTLAQVELVTAPGCGFLEGGERRIGDTVAPIEGCDDWAERFLYPEIRRLQPDVAMVMVSSWDIVDRRWDTEQLLTPFDADFRRRLEAAYATLAESLAENGAFRVAFARHPIPDPFWLPAVEAQEDAGRHAVLFEIYEALAASDPLIDVVSLDRWMTETGLEGSQDVRPDGIHPDPDAATAIADGFLGDQLVRVALGLERP